MPADAYAGHAADSTTKLANTNPDNVARADQVRAGGGALTQADFYANGTNANDGYVAGYVAHTKGHPRHDGKARNLKV